MKSKIFLLTAIVVLFSGCPEDEQSSETSRKNAGTMLDAAHRLITYADSHPLDKAMECEGLSLGQNVMHINVKVMGLCPLNMPEQELINVHLYKVASTGCWGAYVTYNFISAMTCIPTKALSGSYCIRSKFCMKPSNILAYALGAWAQQALDQIYWYLVLDQILDVPVPAPEPTPTIVDDVAKQDRDEISLLLGGIAIAVLYLVATEYSFASAISSLDPAATLNLWSAGMIQSEWQTKETRINVLTTANEIESAMSQVDFLASTIVPVDSIPGSLPRVSTPYVSPQSGMGLEYPVTINLSCDTPGATIVYTVDGSIPSRTNGTVHNGLASTYYWWNAWTVKAFAYKDEMLDSDMVTRTYQVVQPSTVDAVISPNGGTFSTSITWSVSCSTPGSTIVVTCDGTIPTRTNGFVYSGPMQSYGTSVVKAWAYKNGWPEGNVVTATFTQVSQPTGTVSTPTFSPNGGSFTSSQTWYVNCSTSGATIMVTCDGSTPSPSNGVVYSGGMQSFGTTIAKAMAYKSGMTNSSVATATFTQVSQPPSQVADPIIFPGGGTFSTSVIWSVSTSTSGATIRVTTDGSTPSPTNGWVYTGPLQSYGTTIAKAIAYKSGMNNSNVVTVTFTKQ